MWKAVFDLNVFLLDYSRVKRNEENAEAHSVMNKMAVPGFYRIWTREENLDAVFITAMAFARTGALNDEGGAFGKQIRTSVFGK